MPDEVIRLRLDTDLPRGLASIREEATRGASASVALADSWGKLAAAGTRVEKTYVDLLGVKRTVVEEIKREVAWQDKMSVAMGETERRLRTKAEASQRAAQVGQQHLTNVLLTANAIQGLSRDMEQIGRDIFPDWMHQTVSQTGNLVGMSAQLLATAKATEGMTGAAKGFTVAGAVMGAAMGGWQLGRMIAEMTGLDAAIQGLTASLIELDRSGVRPLSQDQAGYRLESETLRLINQKLGTSYTDLTTALQVHASQMQQNRNAAANLREEQARDAEQLKQLAEAHEAMLRSLPSYDNKLSDIQGSARMLAAMLEKGWITTDEAIAKYAELKDELNRLGGTMPPVVAGLEQLYKAHMAAADATRQQSKALREMNMSDAERALNELEQAQKAGRDTSILYLIAMDAVGDAQMEWARQARAAAEAGGLMADALNDDDLRTQQLNLRLNELRHGTVQAKQVIDDAASRSLPGLADSAMTAAAAVGSIASAAAAAASGIAGISGMTLSGPMATMGGAAASGMAGGGGRIDDILAQVNSYAKTLWLSGGGALAGKIGAAAQSGDIEALKAIANQLVRSSMAVGGVQEKQIAPTAVVTGMLNVVGKLISELQKQAEQQTEAMQQVAADNRSAVASMVKETSPAAQEQAAAETGKTSTYRELMTSGGR